MNDEWKTPEWFMRLFMGWDDPCLPGRTDGLTRTWRDPVFVNPPYSDPKPWVAKGIREASMGKRVVMLLRHDSSTEWWRMLVEAKAEMFAHVGRMHFSKKDRSPFPVILVILRGGRDG